MTERKATDYSVDGPVAVVTLSRPHRGNAWTGRMHAEYREALAAAEDDRAVRVVVVTGAGRAFCVGADSQALSGHAEKGAYDDGVRQPLATPGFGVRPEFDGDWSFHFGLSKPLVAAINGPAAGVGLVLACYCDVRLAVPGAKLTTAHGKLNLPAEMGLSWLLPRLVGLSRATELLLSSRVFTTDEAHQMGLVARLFESADLLAESVSYARDLAATVSRSALAATRRQVYGDQHGGIAASVAESDRLLREMVREPDYTRGVEALMEKRPPAFE